MASAWAFHPGVLRGRLFHQAGNVVQSGLTEIAQVGVCREDMTQQSVGVFVRAARPSGMRVAKPDVDFSRRAGSGWQAISGPRLSVNDRRSTTGNRFICRVKPVGGANGVNDGP